jgi:hypothetical protein
LIISISTLILKAQRQQMSVVKFRMNLNIGGFYGQYGKKNKKSFIS